MASTLSKISLLKTVDMDLSSYTIESVGNDLDREWTEQRQKLYDELCKKKWEEMWQFSSNDLNKIAVHEETTDKEKYQSDNEANNNNGETLGNSRDEGEESLSKLQISHEKKWMKWYTELIKYKKEFGHCDVHKHDNSGNALRRWVCTQRLKRKHLSERRVQFLESIGFAWHEDRRQNLWEQRYSELKQHVKMHGHFFVERSGEMMVLARWCDLQRVEYWKKKKGKKSRMTEERLEALEEISFPWKLRRQTKDRSGIVPL